MQGVGPISIVHVLHHLVIGGMENGMVNLINQLPADRFKHTVVCIEDFSEFRNRITRTDVEVLALHRSNIGLFRMRWRLYRLFRRLRPDIVHSRNMSGLDALLPARLAGAATLHSEHGFDVDNVEGKDRKQRWLRKLHAPLVQQFVTVSEHLRRMLTDAHGIAPARVAHICNGVDTAHFEPPLTRAHALLPEPLQAAGLFVVGTVGRVRPIKDQATLLRALAAVLAQRPAWTHLRLVLVGDGPLLTELKALAQQLGIAPMCWFTGARHDVQSLLQAFDLFVLPSLNEGISNTLLEAMATGLPTLATRVGGNVELIDVGVTGDTFAVQDVQALATLIEQHAADPAASALLGRAARQRVVQRFSLSAMVESYRAVYEDLHAAHCR